ncbi:unnamed protein product [Brachionus calyciflorus]|uniref:Peptidase S1 domain-containing protein n=1 Tax=Brachionus calyciflorus TaxID=104777 RepID=A0A814L3A5_9BILA|nr:unnamed protein product [Brachionus calyciflorus]
MILNKSLGKKKNVEKQNGKKHGTQNKIINGQLVKGDNHPWMVSLGFLGADSYFHLCGGSIISNKHILTAAHCVTDLGNNFNYREYYKKNGNFLVGIVGVKSLDKNKDVFSLFEYTNMMLITKITYNTNYTDVENPYDVAVLNINREFAFSNQVSKINLPLTVNHKIVFGAASQIAGWGVTEKKTVSIDLLHANVTIISGNKKLYSDENNYCVLDLTRRKANICFGDSGGPLVVYQKGIPYVYGVASYVYTKSDETCNNTSPSYFTMVPKNLEWIKKQLV